MSKYENTIHNFFEDNSELISYLEDVNKEIKALERQSQKFTYTLTNPSNEEVKGLIQTKINDLQAEILNLEGEKIKLSNALDLKFSNIPSTDNSKKHSVDNAAPYIPDEIFVEVEPDERLYSNSSQTKSTDEKSSDNQIEAEKKESKDDDLKAWKLLYLLPIVIVCEAYKNPKNTAKVAAISGIIALGIAGGHSFSKYKSSNEIVDEPMKQVTEYKLLTNQSTEIDEETAEQKNNRLEPKRHSVILKTEFASRTTLTRAEIQKFRNLKDKFIDISTKEELYLSCNKDITECTKKNEQSLASVTLTTGLLINKKSNARIIACPNSNVDKAIITNSINGFETIAVLGTGTVAETNPRLLKEIQSQKSNHVFAFQDKSGKFRSPAGDQFVRFPNGKTLETNYRNYFKRTGQNIGMRDAGFYTMKDGKMYLLDFLGKSTAERDKKLDELTKNPNVQSFSMTGWVTRTQNHEIYNNKSPQARTVFVFNEKNKAFQGIMYMPPIRFDQINRYAKKMYGKDAIGLNLDGDFYAGMLDLRGITTKTIDSKSLTQRIEMYYQQSGMCLVVPKTNPQINQIPEVLKSKAQAKADERRNDDKVGDVWEQLIGVWNKVTGFADNAEENKLDLPNNAKVNKPITQKVKFGWDRL